MSRVAKRNSKKASRWNPFILLLKGLIFISIIGTALLVGSLAGWASNSDSINAAAKQVILNTTPQTVFAGKSSVNLLILGCDQDLYYKGLAVLKSKSRSDLMMIARIDFDGKKITGVSIPRDTQLTLDGRTHKINAYYSLAENGNGPEASLRAVQALLPGVHIDRVIDLDFDAFQDLVDLVGGVPVVVTKKMKHIDRAGGLNINFKPGPILLDGYNAMMYVRYRNDSDFMRQKRQREFIVAFKQRMRRRAELLPQIADTAKNVLGKSMTTDEIVAIALFAGKVPASQIKMGQVPVKEGRGTNLRLDEDKVEEVLMEFDLLQGRVSIQK